MNSFECLRPQTVAEALAWMTPPAEGPGAAAEGRAWLAGGQSLLAAMKFGMASSGLLLDLQDVPGLRDIRTERDAQGATVLWIGAMATHASVAASAVVRQHAPGLAALAGGIADAQVRNMGTLGGSLAHNDPAACWPAGVLAAGATVVTSQRAMAADDFFQGLYTTALRPGELILGVRVPPMQALHYIKFEQRASRFALVGVAVARWDQRVRVAVTGLGSGVVRWPSVEQRLGAQWSLAALLPQVHGDPSFAGDPLSALGDLHASADYRCHLAQVLVCQCVAALTAQRMPGHAPLAPRALSAQGAGAAVLEEPPKEGFGGQQALQATPEQVWQGLLDPQVLRQSIPGCESLLQTSASRYEATVKVGLGPLSVRFSSTVTLQDLQPPHALVLVFKGSARALGTGEGRACVRLVPSPAPADVPETRLHWWVQVQMTGRLAQFGNRLVEASARQLSAEFFQRFGMALCSTRGLPAAGRLAGQQDHGAWPWPWMGRFLRRLLSIFGK